MERSCGAAMELELSGVIVGDRQQAEGDAAGGHGLRQVPSITSDRASILSRAGSSTTPQARFQDHRGGCSCKMPAWNAPLGGKNVLVLGSEAHGIHEELLAECDERVFDTA